MRKVLYGILGILISSFVFVILLSEIPDLVTAKSSLSEFKEYEKDRDSFKDEYTDEDYEYKEIPLVYFKTYHVREADMEDYIISKVIIYGRINPMFHWIRENLANPIGSDESEGEGEDENGYQDEDEGEDNDNNFGKFAVGYDMERNELVTINTDKIKSIIKNSGKLPISENLYVVSSGFGPRKDPFDKSITTFHIGLDIASENIDGREVTPVLPGVISAMSSNNGYGNYIIIDHGGFATIYAHLEGFGRVNIGEEVATDRIIGYVGNTGRSTGHHLHLEFDINGIKVDPEPFMNIIRGEYEVEEGAYGGAF